MSVGEHIRAVRESLGESQVQFCVRLGVGLSSVQRWEEGKTVPTRYLHIERLAAEGVPREALVSAVTEQVAL